jgi:hypothetical protein
MPSLSNKFSSASARKISRHFAGFSVFLSKQQTNPGQFPSVNLIYWAAGHLAALFFSKSPARPYPIPIHLRGIFTQEASVAENGCGSDKHGVCHNTIIFLT